MKNPLLLSCIAGLLGAALSYAGPSWTPPTVPTKVQVNYNTYSPGNQIQQTPMGITIVGGVTYAFPLKDQAASDMLRLLADARTSGRPVEMWVDPAFTVPVALLGGTVTMNYPIIQAVSLD